MYQLIQIYKMFKIYKSLKNHKFILQFIDNLIQHIVLKFINHKKKPQIHTTIYGLSNTTYNAKMYYYVDSIKLQNNSKFITI